MKKNQFIEKAIDWAEKQGFQKIKANYDDYETPTQYTRSKSDQAFVPDVTGMKKGGKSYIEIANKSDNVRRKVSKWKLLATLAQAKGGELFLLAPRGHKTFTEKVVKRHNLEANVVYLRN
jgi:hypothetical protein